MEARYSVRREVVDNLKSFFSSDDEACGFILGERFENLTEKEEEKASGKVLGFVNLLGYSSKIVKQNESNVDHEPTFKTEFNEFLLAGIPGGIEIVGVFVVHHTPLLEWKEEKRLEFLKSFFSEINSLDDIGQEYLVFSLTPGSLLTYSYFREELLGFDRLDIVDLDKGSEEQRQQEQTFRLTCSWPVYIAFENQIASFNQEIDCLMTNLRTNRNYEYFLPDVNSTLERRLGLLADDDENQLDTSEARKIINMLPEKQPSEQIIPVQLIKFHARDEIDDFHVEVPVLSFGKSEEERIKVNIKIDCMLQTSKDTSVLDLVSLLDQAITQQLTAYKYLYKRFSSEFGTFFLSPFHFKHEVHEFFVTCLYPLDSERCGQINDEKLMNYRRDLHRAYVIRDDMPFFKPTMSYFNNPDTGRLINPHEDIPAAKFSGGTLATVRGKYSYYHYMQDGMDDNGWGCAYRSLQTLCSWFNHQGYHSINVPTHKQIQQALVDIGDKGKSFVGSRQWIGSFEVSMCLEHFLGIKSKILHVSAGSEMGSKGRELLQHFRDQGTPIMIGGGVLAHTILGVLFNELTGEVKFLILDPHYTGVDEVKPVVTKGWCGWKGVDFWDQTAHYNMCLPQRPVEI